ncbi:hypothetical protein FOXYSP1_01057 [Fusarium oxysporum f. sp. phaseoli]
MHRRTGFLRARRSCVVILRVMVCRTAYNASLAIMSISSGIPASPPKAHPIYHTENTISRSKYNSVLWSLPRMSEIKASP